MKRPNSDTALWFFGLAALACLLVSLPATLAAMQLFHGNYIGVAATFVFEIGAVGAELASLAIPQWRKRLMLLTITLLALTTGGNYALGVDHFGGAALDSGTTYATIRAADWGWLLAIMSSAIFPALLFVFLTAFTARFKMVRGGYDTPMAAVAFWLAAHWQTVADARHDLAGVRQVLAERDIVLAATRQALADTKRTLAERPAPETVEVVIVAKHRLTWPQLERAVAELRQLDSISQTTIRRHVAALATSDDLVL